MQVFTPANVLAIGSSRIVPVRYDPPETKVFLQCEIKGKYIFNSLGFRHRV